MNDQLSKYRAQIDEQVSAVTKNLEQSKKERHYVPYADYILCSVKAEFARLLGTVGVNVPDFTSIRVELPPSHVDADLTISVFEYVKQSGKKPKDLADEVVRAIMTSRNIPDVPSLPNSEQRGSSSTFNSASDSFITSATSAPGYVNIKLSRSAFYDAVIKQVLSFAKNYGKNDIAKSKTVLIDFSAPNIAKPFGVGHLRSTVIGEALARMYEAVGFSVVRDNHLGDWGTQFGVLICAYKKWGNDEQIEKNPIEELKNLYTRYSADAENDETLKDEARKTFAALENGDPELMKLWQKFRDWSLLVFKQTYDEFKISFDLEIGESYYTESADDLVNDLLKKGIATNSDGAVAVEKLENLPSFLLKKTDGSTLYVLRDLMCIIHRKKVFNPDVLLYVVGSEQQLNFRQLFALAKAAGIAGQTLLKHIGFGLVLIDGKKMSTRKGTLINLDEVLATLTTKAKDIMLARGDADTNALQGTARKLAISAVIYNDLRQNRLTDIDFNWEKMLSLESGSVVYLQYAYARIKSILAKSGIPAVLNFAEMKSQHYVSKEESEFALVKRLAIFPDTINRAVEHDSPHLVAEFLEALASEVNQFYVQASVMNAENEELKNSRLHLLSAVASCIENAFELLNIPILERI